MGLRQNSILATGPFVIFRFPLCDRMQSWLLLPLCCLLFEFDEVEGVIDASSHAEKNWCSFFG